VAFAASLDLSLKQSVARALARVGSYMRKIPCTVMACGVLWLLLLAFPASVDAHAAFERSDPAAGATLTEAPAEIRIWFTEPLEQSYTGADLLDAAGAKVPDITVAIAPDDGHQLIIDPPADLPEGGYTVAWRTLSAADGHTLEGYFGFRIGTGSAGGTVTAVSGSSQSDPLRGLARGLALIGLAALLAIAPLTLWLFDPIARTIPDLSELLRVSLRRYAVLAALVAMSGSAVALIAQATAIAPDASIVTAIAQTLGDTRYGRLWLIRIGLLLAIAVLITVAFRASDRQRRALLVAASALALAAPIPVSLLSHAAAQQEGQVTAVAGDTLHLLAASVWVGGLFMLVLVLLPALFSLSAEQRLGALRLAIPRFSAIGLAAWGILVLSGLYAAWLQVGTVGALRDTDYGRALLLKGALLLPVLILAAYHFLLGWRGISRGDAAQAPRTFVVEALIVAAVLLVVGRLIALEPAREVMASRTPVELTLPIAFATDDGERTGRLTISPGAPGVNTFAIDLDGAAFSAEAEGVLRFSLSSQEIGQQELRLPATGPNRFSAEGSELALPGQWQVSAIVRQIGQFSWSTEVIAPIALTAPSAPEANPAPHFGSAGAWGMIALAIGMCALGVALASRSMAANQRGVVSTAGIVAVLAGVTLLSLARLPEPEAVVAAVHRAALPAKQPSPQASPATEADAHDHHATPRPDERRAAVGTPVAIDGLSVTLEVDPERSGSTDVTVVVAQADGAPLSGARVAIISEMAGMAGREETKATETEPGHYLASDVPLTMAGEWRLTVRVSPKGASTQVIPFSVAMP
jgi:copper transport protein